MKYAVSLQSDGRNQTLQDDIDQAISIILFTRPGERIYDPKYGCRLLDMLDAPHYFLQLAMVSIIEALDKYERRIDVMSVDVGKVSAAEGSAALAQGVIMVRLTYKLSVSGVIKTRAYYSDGQITTLAA